MTTIPEPQSLPLFPDKFCPRCGLSKPPAEFSRDRCRPDGLAAYCRLCNRARASQWAKANPEKANARNRAWRERNPERRWAAPHPDRQRACTGQ